MAEINNTNVKKKKQKKQRQQKRGGKKEKAIAFDRLLQVVVQETARVRHIRLCHGRGEERQKAHTRDTWHAAAE